MKIVRDFPPNYKRLCEAFAIADRPNIVFTFGDALYFGGKGEITLSFDLRVHEETHREQQARIGVADWWDRYIEAPAFRLRQEVEAYHNQYIAMRKSDREKHIRRIAGDLSGPIYGNLVSFEEAKRLIRSGLTLLEGNIDRNAREERKLCTA